MDDVQGLERLLFFVGLHQPADAHRFLVACISIQRLWGRKKPIPNCRILVDSGAFMELKLHGKYRETVESYAAELYRLHTQGVITIAAAVAQDYMCEPFMLAITGLTVEEHQRLTIERYDALVQALERLFGGPVPFPVMPVLQGYSPAEYVRHLKAYGRRLTHGMWVGVGSVCKRNGSPEKIVDVVRPLKLLRPDLRLHGFGVKQTSLANGYIRHLFATADSMAWSAAARWDGGDRNSWKSAAAFAEVVQGYADLPPVDPGADFLDCLLLEQGAS